MERRGDERTNFHQWGQKVNPHFVQIGLMLTDGFFIWKLSAIVKMKEKGATELESGTNASVPLFIYTPKDSRLRFLAPKHTSRLLFLSEVPHSTKRLGDRAKASWGQRTSVHPPSLYVTFHTLATSCQKIMWRASANLNQKCDFTARYVRIIRVWSVCV